MAAAYGNVLLPKIPERLHKLPVLREIFDSHDFQKAVVFVDRLCIAQEIVDEFRDLNPVLFAGRGATDQKNALVGAKQEGTKLVVATSAGEEGIDLPSADLLVIWGNAVSDIRFIQRLGRMMRKVGEGLKFATFVVTPESSDFDSFNLGLERASMIGAVDMEKVFGWDNEVLWPKTSWWHITESLRNRPTGLKDLEEGLNLRDSLAEKIIGSAVKRGRVFYLYNVAQIATDVARHYLELDADRFEFAKIWG